MCEAHEDGAHGKFLCALILPYLFDVYKEKTSELFILLLLIFIIFADFFLLKVNFSYQLKPNLNCKSIAIIVNVAILSGCNHCNYLIGIIFKNDAIFFKGYIIFLLSEH